MRCFALTIHNQNAIISHRKIVKRAESSVLRLVTSQRSLPTGLSHRRGNLDPAIQSGSHVVHETAPKMLLIKL